MRSAFKAAVFALVLGGSSALAQQTPQEWDGLVRVDSRFYDVVYLAPGADFGPYTKVMLDATEVAFKRNWQRDYNNQARGLSNRISDEEAQEILAAAASGFQDVFAEQYRRAGYEVVTTPGPDVLRLRTAVIDLDVAAPDLMTPGRSRTYATEAGEATIVLEARDSMSGAILGRAVDRRAAGDNSFVYRRTSVSNRADFSRMFRAWAEHSAEALARLRETPAPAAGAVGQD